jgi:hypothetical protein
VEERLKHIKDYPTATLAPWEFKHRGEMIKEILDENPITSQALITAKTMHIFL